MLSVKIIDSLGYGTKIVVGDVVHVPMTVAVDLIKGGYAVAHYVAV